MKIVISGATGFIGQPLVSSLKDSGHDVLVLSRHKAAGQNYWNPEAGVLDRSLLEGTEAVVHLAGEPLASGRWTNEKKKKILESRVLGTRLLSEAMASLSSKPSVFVSASAIGFYGDHGDSIIDESSLSHGGFLSDVCQKWEEAAFPASEAGIRVVHPRLGVVLGKGGGVLKSLPLAFKMGLGGRIGSGQQFMSWVTLDDVVAILRLVLNDQEISGPVNVVAPHPVRNADFVTILGKVLHRPTLAAVPEFMLKMALGEMAKELLLSSLRVQPKKLMDVGYPFLFSNIEEALQALL